MGQQSSNATLRWGVIGAVIAALCCFTPVLAILLGVVGLSWAVGYLDYVLFPALAFFTGLTIYALWKRQKTARLASSAIVRRRHSRRLNVSKRDQPHLPGSPELPGRSQHKFISKTTNHESTTN